MSYCTRCGNPIPQGYAQCPRCGSVLNRAGGEAKNIFTALTREKTPGVIAEFTLWCVVCCIALMSLIAAIVGSGNVTWIFLMLFTLGLGVLTAFRLKPIAMLYSICTFNFILPIIHYACFAKSASAAGYVGLTSTVRYSPFNITLFVLLLLVSIAAIACGFVYNFTRFHLQNALTILVLVDCGLAFLLHILMYAAPASGTSVSDKEWFTRYVRAIASAGGYWFGTVVFWSILVVVMLYYIFFFWGIMRGPVKRICDMSGYRAASASRSIGKLRGICGVYAGYEIPLNGGELIVGSGNSAQVRVADAYVSEKHCAIRYNPATSLYEIRDLSSNGVYLLNGIRLQYGVYSAVSRGTIICIGSQAQQFKLM